MADELLTVPEAAERVKVNPETIRRWIKSGRLPAAQPAGGPYRIHSADLERLVGVSPKAEAPSPPPESAEEGRRDFYEVSQGDLARLFRNLTRRGQRIVDQSVREGPSEQLSREAADYHEETDILLRVKGGRDIRGRDPEELAAAVEAYEEVEARIRGMLKQDTSADKTYRPDPRFKKGAEGGYTAERGADVS